MDVLNIIATIFVMFLHSSEFAFNYVPNSFRWVLSLVIQCIFIPAVPIFIMLSGGNLLNYLERYNTKVFFKKRFLRTFVPFIFWSVTWYYYHYFSNIRPLWNRNLFSGILNDQIQPIFWFFYSIFGLYVITPILAKIMTKSNRKLIEYMIIGCLLFTGILKYYYGIVGETTPTLFSSVPIFTSSALIYYLMGWYLKNIPITIIKTKIIYIWGIFSLLVMVGLTVTMTIIQHKTARPVYTVFGIFAMLYSVALYQFIKSSLVNWVPSKKVAVLIKNLSSYSLGIYLIHEFIIYFFEDIVKLPESSYYHMMILPIIVYVLSALIVYALKKIPFIQLVLP